MNNYPRIEAFPDDQQLRVIWWYGPVFKNNSNSSVPLVKILTKLLTPDGKLSEKIQIFKVTLPELDIIRIGTIWKGRKRLNRVWKYLNGYAEGQEFSFDFREHPPLSIHFSDKKPNSTYWHIPKFKYDLGNFEEHSEHKFQFYNSTLTKLISTNGLTVLIPSLEFLTSAISPEHKQIRSSLLQYSLDDLTSRHLKRAAIDTNGDYLIELIEGRLDANLTLLAYLRLNQTSRARLSKLWASMQRTAINKSTGLAYEDKYPEVLPFHPTEMTLLGDGIKIDENTFLVLRINGFSLPTDHDIRLLSTLYKTNPKESNGSSGNSSYYNPEEVEEEDLDVTNNSAPHWQAGTAHIRSEVSVIGYRPSITEQLEVKENNVPKTPKEDGKQEASDLSSGEPDNREDSSGTAALKVSSLENPMQLSDNFKKIVDALQALAKDDKSSVSDFFYVSDDASERTSPTYCMIGKTYLPADYTGKWHTVEKIDDGTEKPKYRLRKFLLLKVVLNDNRSAYLLEIQRKNSESFFGLLFCVPNGAITSRTIIDLLGTIAKNRGVYTKRKNSSLVPIELPVSPILVFRHYENIDMSTQLSRAIKRAIDQNIFV